MTTEQYYDFYLKYANSDIFDEFIYSLNDFHSSDLINDNDFIELIENFCIKYQINVDYFLMEFV